MYLSELTLQGYKNFGNPFTIKFSKGLNVLIGENGVGKSAIIDALRLILLEDEFGRSSISDADFHREFRAKSRAAEAIKISVQFGELSKEEMVAFLPWTELSNNAQLSLQIDNKPSNRGRYKRAIWGGVSRNSIFEWELLETIHCIYLPPLRDAESKLREGRGSRLARLLRVLNKDELKKLQEDGQPHPLEERVAEFNRGMVEDTGETISQANVLIKTKLREALGSVFGQDTSIQFSETNFSRIAESLRLLFFPDLSIPDKERLYRSLEENSLGYNNLLYLATVLAELTGDDLNGKEYLKVLLIEEPEAHLHPQLQVRLLKYLENQTEQNPDVQVIVTTHSPVLASAVSLETISHLSRNKGMAISIKDCGLTSQNKSFLSRWLDVTKSTLLFAKGVILVEGIAEALVLPELASRVLRDYNKPLSQDQKIPETLEEQGVAVINMNGIYFKHFMQLFCNLGTEDHLSIPVLCAGITDNDPEKEALPTPDNPVQGKNHALLLKEKVNASPNCRLYSNLKTFEYDLALEGDNLSLMIEVLLEMLETDGPMRSAYQKRQAKVWTDPSNREKAEIAGRLLNDISSKGEFAQMLADKLGSKDIHYFFSVPEYIKRAILWVVGVSDD